MWLSALLLCSVLLACYYLGGINRLFKCRYLLYNELYLCWYSVLSKQEDHSQQVKWLSALFTYKLDKSTVCLLFICLVCFVTVVQMVTIVSPLSNLLPFLFMKNTFLKGTAYWRVKFSYLLTWWWLDGPSLSTKDFWSFTAKRPCSILPNYQSRWVLVSKFWSLKISDYFANLSANFLSRCKMWEYTLMMSFQRPQ